MEKLIKNPTFVMVSIITVMILSGVVVTFAFTGTVTSGYMICLITALTITVRHAFNITAKNDGA